VWSGVKAHPLATDTEQRQANEQGLANTVVAYSDGLRDVCDGPSRPRDLDGRNRLSRQAFGIVFAWAGELLARTLKVRYASLR
jgi:hypothetical protein